MRIAVYEQPGFTRARVICEAMARGIKACGDVPTVLSLSANPSTGFDGAVFYGFREPLPRIMDLYREAGRFAVHIDLGYWGRVDGGSYAGYHKVAVNARHPTAYFQRRKHPADRISRFGVQLKPWRAGNHVLVCGMSEKHAKSEKMAHQEWEKATIERLMAVTDREIRYRPKPGDLAARDIPGACRSRGGPIQADLEGCHAVVSLHSNVAIDALVAGVPSFSLHGVGTVLGLSDFDLIESPIYPDGREQWLADVAYCQFNVDEMANGTVWRHLRDDGIIP